MTSKWKRGPYTVSCEPEDQNPGAVAEFLRTSYWAEGIPAETVEKAMESSLCFSLLDGDMHVGFARVITDYATFAYLADVYVEEGHRGRDLGKWLMECVVAHPRLQGLRRWMLATRDAHGLYESYGFTPLKVPSWFMERHDPGIYTRQSTAQGSAD